jgi:hypothetical protein
MKNFRPINLKGVSIIVDYRYDIHKIMLSAKEWGYVTEGESIELDGHGFNCEGVLENDYWEFNKEFSGSLYVGCINGREIYHGKLSDSEVTIDESQIKS